MQQKKKKMLLGNCSLLELWYLCDVAATGRNRQSAFTLSLSLALPQICFVSLDGWLGLSGPL